MSTPLETNVDPFDLFDQGFEPVAHVDHEYDAWLEQEHDRVQDALADLWAADRDMHWEQWARDMDPHYDGTGRY